MKNKIQLSLNKFIAGVFFLVWATNGYVLGGSLGKYLSLFTGFFLISTSVFKYSFFKQSNLLFVLKTIALIGLYVIIAFLLNQKTLDPLSLVFGFINIILFVSGYVFSQRIIPQKNISLSLIFFMAILTLMGAIKLYTIQAIMVTEGSRYLGDETLNAVGVAYVYGQLFLLFFCLFKKGFPKYMKFLLLITLCAIIVIILITESRGALLYLFLTLVWFYKQKLKLIFRLKYILLIIVVVTGLLLIFRTNKIIERKIEAVSNRFESAFNHISHDTELDRSLEVRNNTQSVFFDDYDKMFFGYDGYIPYPHNQYIEIYMRWGIFGIPLLLISLISFKRALGFAKSRNQSVSSIWYLIVTIFFFCYLQSMSSLSLEMNRMMWFGFGLLISDSLERNLIKMKYKTLAKD